MSSQSASTSSSAPRRRSRRGRHWAQKSAGHGGAYRYTATETRSTWMAKPPKRVTMEATLEVEELEEMCQIGMDDILPDDVLEKIFARLPIASMFRACTVCTRWRRILKSRQFYWSFSKVMYREPWYFMLTCNEIRYGYSYDPVVKKWYSGIELPDLDWRNFVISSSCGLVSIMDSDCGNRVHISNPITNCWRDLGEPPGTTQPSYASIALSVDRISRCHGYHVLVTKSTQLPDDFVQWNFSVSIFDSQIGIWSMSLEETFVGWRGGDESVICNGLLYCMVYASGILRCSENRHAVIFYDFLHQSSSPQTPLLKTLVWAPCSLTCARIMNLKERLILVGGIGRQDRSDIIKGIGIWELIDNKHWRELSRMPRKFFQGFGELDDVFSSTGSYNLVYIQTYSSPALLSYDINLNQWRWVVPRCPAHKKFPLQLFTGFAFEPRIDVST